MTGDTGSTHSREIASGQRFGFGKNWRSFLARLNEDRIREACRSLAELLRVNTLQGRNFLDVGSGSGLFSLAAMRLGADEVCSFDFDPASVECAMEMKRRYHPEDARWRILEGSVLDRAFLDSLGRYSVVYSWGVLHHTGAMWRALDNIRSLVAPGGQLAVAIYNNQGWRSKAWRGVKKLYCRIPRTLRAPVFFPVPLYFEGKWMAMDLMRGKVPFAAWRSQSARGMNPWHDWIDWLGGYPYEVARPDEIFDFFRRHGFVLERLVTCMGGFANNEFVFRAPRTEDAGTT